MKISMIVAVDPETGIIGVDGKLPWHIPKDLRRFKELTTGNAVVMGRKTWESLPVKPLPNRINVVVSRHASYGQSQPGVIHTVGLSRALYILMKSSARVNTAFIIGGASMYDEIMELEGLSEMHLTEVNLPVEYRDIPDERVSRVKLMQRFKFCNWKVVRREIHSDHIYYHLMK